jgi:predicted GIY-YIG superfamily endonuclease
MTRRYYVYMLHESPIEPPYYCKVGFTDNPQRRLAQLQAGNPRALRTWSQERRPNGNFGFALPTKKHALNFEKRLFSKFHEMGVRLRRDYNYQRDVAEIREWIELVKPGDLWLLMLLEYKAFVNEERIAHLVAPELATYGANDAKASPAKGSEA